MRVKDLVKMGLLAFEYQEYDQALQVSIMLYICVKNCALFCKARKIITIL